MWRNALQRSSMSSAADRWRSRKSVWIPAGMLLTVGGCSDFQALVGLHDPPSLNVAEAALSAGAPDLALRVADLAAAKQPNDAQTLTAKGDALYAMGQFDLAQTAYRAAVAIDPSAVAAQVGLGRTLARSDPQAAEAAFQAALKHDPDNLVALSDLGVICDVQGHHEDAQKAYRHALAVSPESIDVQVNLGRSLALSGRADDARELLHAIAADPGATQRWRVEIAAALNVAGDTKSAQRLLLAGNARPEQELSETRVAQSGGSALLPLPSRPEMAQNAPTERFADAAGGNGNLPRTAVEDTPPMPVRAPRIAVAQAELPPILPELEATTPRGDVPQIASAKKSPSDSKVEPDAVAKAPEAMEAISALSPSGPSGPPDPRPARQESTIPAEQRSALVNAPYVQVASLTSEADAIFEWHRLGRRFPDLLTAREPTITTAGVNGRTYWRLRAFGFADIEGARDLCVRLIHVGLQCFTGQGL